MKRISKLNTIILLVAIATGFALYFLITDEEPVIRNLTEPQTITETLPEPEEPEVQEVVFLPAGVLDCGNDCSLAPVDKQHSLPSSYVPTVEPTGLSGGRELEPITAQATRDLFSAAADDGVSMSVISAYRSYSYQAGLFNRYVEEEKARGLSQSEAEEEANTYSAKPGTSEHQLGTTVDIGCVGCAFEESDANWKVWNWLAGNASDFGFVISYPEGRTADTGYIYEPWHYRYIGVENAKKFVNQSEYTLNQWLAIVPSPAS